MNHLTTVDLGRTKYADAWELQRRVFDARRDGRLGDILLLTEHDHVYTVGKGGDMNHVLANSDELREKHVDLVAIDRGGDVTYHGPGQLVGYPILDLNLHYKDIHRYLRELEESLILALREFGVDADRAEGYTGVWVKNDKIAAIGIKVSRWTTMHGFALNVAPDLSFFDRIIPCGIFHKGITSMRDVLGQEIPLHQVAKAVVRNFAAVFNMTQESITPDKLFELTECYAEEH
jgi:lipoyl(octanoyl) transferase